MLDNTEQNDTNDGQEPKKRKRVRIATESQKTPYRSSENNRPQTSSYNSERGEQRSYSSNREGNNENYENRRSYNSSDNNRQGSSYNRDDRQNSYGSGNDRQNSYGGGDRQRSYNNGGDRQNSYGGGDRQRSYNNGGDRQNSYGGGDRQRSYNNVGDRQNSYGGGGERQRSYNNDRGGYDRENSYNNGNQYPSNRNFQKPRFNKPKEGPKRLLKPVKFKENHDPNDEVRLNKYLANAGVCSRREADTFITAGSVKVNGEVIKELGYKITYADEVMFNERVVNPESKVYVLLNKPKNCVTTSDDPENRITVLDLVKNACSERIYPVGRLDRNTTGVLLLTNDGDLASKLMHPKFKKKKTYQVTLDRPVTPEDMQKIADGVELDDGEIHADSIAYVSEEAMEEIGIEIHSGRNRIVRRIFEKLNYRVVKLDRVYFSGLTKKNVPRGKWRYLTAEEVNILRMGSFE